LEFLVEQSQEKANNYEKPWLSAPVVNRAGPAASKAALKARRADESLSDSQMKEYVQMLPAEYLLSSVNSGNS